MELRMVPRQRSRISGGSSFRLRRSGPRHHRAAIWTGSATPGHAFTINDFHDRIKIEATSVVETERPPHARDCPVIPGRSVECRTHEYHLHDFLQLWRAGR